MTLKVAAVVIRKPDGKIKVEQATRLMGAGMVGGRSGACSNNSFSGYRG